MKYVEAMTILTRAVLSLRNVGAGLHDEGRVGDATGMQIELARGGTLLDAKDRRSCKIGDMDCLPSIEWAMVRRSTRWRLILWSDETLR